MYKTKLRIQLETSKEIDLEGVRVRKNVIVNNY